MQKQHAGPTLHELAEQLRPYADAIGREMLRGAVRKGHGLRCDSMHGGEGDAFVLNIGGQMRGRWFDFREDRGGDLLDLVAECRFGGNIGDAALWAKERLGIATGVTPAERPMAPPPAPPPEEDQAEIARRHARAMRAYLEARPIAGTPVELYLQGRGIDLRALGRFPRAIGFHPRLWHDFHRCDLPAMVAAIHNAAGEQIGTHRTYLMQRDGRWKKIPQDAKMMLGASKGGCIRLWRGASMKPLKDAPAGDTVAMAEGIETALSVVVACPELRVLAAGSSGLMHSIDLPPAIETVILCTDHDVKERARINTEKSLGKAIARFQAEGRDVRVARPAVPGADWNDVLQGVEG